MTKYAKKLVFPLHILICIILGGCEVVDENQYFDGAIEEEVVIQTESKQKITQEEPEDPEPKEVVSPPKKPFLTDKSKHQYSIMDFMSEDFTYFLSSDVTGTKRVKPHEIQELKDGYYVKGNKVYYGETTSNSFSFFELFQTTHAFSPVYRPKGITLFEIKGENPDAFQVREQEVGFGDDIYVKGKKIHSEINLRDYEVISSIMPIVKDANGVYFVHSRRTEEHVIALNFIDHRNVKNIPSKIPRFEIFSDKTNQLFLLKYDDYIRKNIELVPIRLMDKSKKHYERNEVPVEDVSAITFHTSQFLVYEDRLYFYDHYSNSNAQKIPVHYFQLPDYDASSFEYSAKNDCNYFKDINGLYSFEFVLFGRNEFVFHKVPIDEWKSVNERCF